MSIAVGSLSSSLQIANVGTISYLSLSSRVRASELRGVLVKYFYQYTHNATLICQTLASSGVNAIYLEVNPFAWTGYCLSYFQEMINACKLYGLTFHVLFTVNAGLDSTYTDTSESYYPYGLTGDRAAWYTNLDDGTVVPFISYSNAATQARIKQVIDVMFQNFPYISDINLDYVRYPTSELSTITNIEYRVPYDSASKTEFLAWLTANNKVFTGTWSDYYYGGSHYRDFATWRCLPINNIVHDVREWTLADNPSAMISADVWTPWQGGWTPDTNPYSLGQDVAYWISHGYLDSVNPMNYASTLSDMQYRVNAEITYWLGGTSKGAIPLVPFMTQGGPGADASSPIPIATFITQINYLRSSGCNGFIFWRYGGPGLSETGTPFTNIVPYLSAIKNNCTNGAFPVFLQSSPTTQGSTITWLTSRSTIGEVEYSSSPLFYSIPENGTYMPYIELGYSKGTILSESAESTSHSIVVPLSQPFYFRIIDADFSIELASPAYLNAG